MLGNGNCISPLPARIRLQAANLIWKETQIILLLTAICFFFVLLPDKALLLQAHEVEVKRQKAEDKLERQLSFPTAAEAPTQVSTFPKREGRKVPGPGTQQTPPTRKESPWKQFSRNNARDSWKRNRTTRRDRRAPSKPQEEGLPEDSASVSQFPRMAAGEKKTERQRKKEKEAKRRKAREVGEKMARLRRQNLFQLRSIRLQVKQWEAELLRRKQLRKAKREAEANKPKRLGRLKYEDADLDVQLRTELADSLRRLKVSNSMGCRKGGGVMLPTLLPCFGVQ
uniref:Ribosome biogenesis protein NOP53 n=1 Tax=Anolis carolinensis TaxID=28377 RepID=H9G988_ANOCA